MIGNLEAWLKLIRDRGQTVREGMLLPIDHFLRRKTTLWPWWTCRLAPTRGRNA
jgi:hypothetical protein